MVWVPVHRVQPYDRERAMAARLALFQHNTVPPEPHDPVEASPLLELDWPDLATPVIAESIPSPVLDWPDLEISGGHAARRRGLLNDFELDARRLRRQ